MIQAPSISSLCWLRKICLPEFGFDPGRPTLYNSSYTMWATMGQNVSRNLRSLPLREAGKGPNRKDLSFLENHASQLLTARDAWCANSAAATTIYGVIGSWDVSAIKFSVSVLFRW